MAWSVSPPTSISLPEPITDDELDNDLSVYDPELKKWRESRTGCLTQTSLTHTIFVRVPENATIWQDDEITSRVNNGSSWMNRDPRGEAMAHTTSRLFRTNGRAWSRRPGLGGTSVLHTSLLVPQVSLYK